MHRKMLRRTVGGFRILSILPAMLWAAPAMAAPVADVRTVYLIPLDATANPSYEQAIAGALGAELHGIDLAKAGPMLEHHPLFPERANISLARVDSKDRITLRVWERGAGLTRACGTAACATMAAAARIKLTGRKATINLPGGDLAMEWRESDDHLLMTGPISYEFEGTLPAHLAV